MGTTGRKHRCSGRRTPLRGATLVLWHDSIHRHGFAQSAIALDGPGDVATHLLDRDVARDRIGELPGFGVRQRGEGAATAGAGPRA